MASGSTQDINVRGTKAFEWLMDSLMLGVGVGFDTKGAGKIEIKAPKDETYVFQVPDSRGGLGSSRTSPFIRIF